MASIFLDCFKNTGKDYLRIVEGYYFKKPDGKATVKRRTIKNLGSLSKFDDNLGDGLLLRLREKFKNKELDIGMPYEELNIPKVKTTIKNIEKELKLKNLGYFFLESLYNQLGIAEVLSQYKSDSKIKYDLNGLTKTLVFGRILNPQSKKATFLNKDNYLFPITTSVKEKEIYRTLDILNEKSISIQKRINTRINQSSIERKTNLTYYDVTNYYFETMYGDEDTYKVNELGEVILDKKSKPIIVKSGLRKRGVSKENKPNPIVGMGLLIDNNGLPVSYDIFPGNMQDKTTFKKIINKTINNLELNKVVVVADNGVYSQENMYLLAIKENGYIISKSVKKHWNTKPKESEEVSLREWALKEKGYNYIKNSDDIIIFKSKSKIYDKELKDKEGNKIIIKEKQIVFWSKKHYERELKQNEEFMKYLEACKDKPNKLKDRQRKSQDFLKVLQTDKKTGEVLKTKPLVILLDNKIKKYKETMGFYSIVTNEIDLSDQEIINRYRGLSRIEDSFRIIKNDLEGRPIYVRTEEHINAHFLVCFMALLITRIIQYKVLKYLGKSTLNTEGWTQGITAEKMKKSLINFQVNHIGDGYYQITKEAKYINLIKKSIGLDEKLGLSSLNEIKSYKNLISSKNL